MKFEKYLILSQSELSEIFSRKPIRLAAYISIAVGYGVCLVNDGINIVKFELSMPSNVGLTISGILTVLLIGIIKKNYYSIPTAIIAMDFIYVFGYTHKVFILNDSICAICVSYSVMYFIINSLIFKLRYAFIFNLFIFMSIFICVGLSLFSDHIAPNRMDSVSELVDSLVLSASGLVLQHMVLTVRAMIIEQLGKTKLQMAALEAKMEIEIARKDAENQTIRLNRISMVEALGASIAHEINQPIGAALTYCQAVRNWSAVECQGAHETLTAIRGVENNVRRAGQLIDNIRSLTSNKDRRYDPVNLHHLVRDQVELVRPEFDRRGIELSLDPSSDDITAVVCAPEIALATINLLRNGMESFGSPTEGAAVSVRCCQPSPDWLEIIVVDNGMGLTSEDIQRAFGAFQTTKQGGVGIGLSICQKVAEHHSGSIALASNSAGGVTATLRIASSLTAD